MGKGGGGGADLSGLEDATKQATALQKEIYDLTREDVQPWYRMGTGAVGRLSDLLGISGGSVQNRDQIYNELMPQYTQTQTTGGGGYLASDAQGNVFDLSTYEGARGAGINPYAMQGYGAPSEYSPDNIVSNLGDIAPNLRLVSAPQTQDITDYEALNAAVNERLGGQTTPDDYGSLLQRFSMEQFEEDPGYQFRKDEAQKALERRMAAQGVTLGGGGAGEINPQAARAMEELSQNLASQEYGQSYNRYVNDQLNTYNMLMGAAGMGQNSTGIMANSGQNYATNVGNLQTGLASARLNSQLANQSSGGGMFGNLLGIVGGGVASGVSGGISDYIGGLF